MRCGLPLLACFIFIVTEIRTDALQQTDDEGPETAGASADQVFGAPTAFDLSADREDEVRIEADASLHSRPAARSPVLARFAAAIEVPVLERRDPWVRVRYGSWQGWVLLKELASDAPTGDAEPWWEPRFGPDPERLERALSLLDGHAVSGLGPYVLYTDVVDETLLGKLSALAGELPEVFRERYGLQAEPGEKETVVLYADDETYRAYVEGDDDPVAADSLGHAVGELAVLAAGQRKPAEVASLLTHELTHLLSYRALGPDLPQWLVEGLAEDLAYCRTSGSGRLVPGTLDGWRSTSSKLVSVPGGGTRLVIMRTRGGPEVSLEEVRTAWRESALPPLDVLVGLPRPDFMKPEVRRIHYSASAFLVRFLLDSDDTAAGFRSYLRSVARGGHGGSDDLAHHLGKPWRELGSDFGRWLMSGAPHRGRKGR